MHLPHLNCLFVHIPKAAGNSIKHAFGIDWEDHKDIAKYREILGDQILADLFKFTFVRNPWDRLFSEYNFQLKKSQRRDTVRLFLNRPDGSVRPFREWVAFALAHPELHTSKEWGGKTSAAVHRLSPQWDWISLDGNIAVDFVGKVENFHSDFESVRNRLGLEILPTKRHNRKFHRHYSRHYDEETRDLVARYYQKDIEAFGYSFEGKAKPKFLSIFFSLLFSVPNPGSHSPAPSARFHPLPSPQPPSSSNLS